jgi:hypothetical protein
MLSIKLFQLVYCLFRFNRNIETLCFGIEAKQFKQTVSKQTKKTADIDTNTVVHLEMQMSSPNY